MTSALENALSSPPPWLMGVLNITPDSFSDGGEFFLKDNALHQARLLSSQGAHIIDIGGESTGPDSSPVSAKKELKRIKDVVRELSSQMFISIDTYKPEVADQCLSLGAQMINDVSALRADPDMCEVISRHKCFAVLMHSKEAPEHPGASDSKKDYKNIVAEIAEFLNERIEYALSNGIAKERIVLDPGMGRFLSTEDCYSWELLSRFDELTASLPYPFLIGTSRKGFLGGAVSDRDSVSQLTSLLAYNKGAQIIRTHNVEMAREFVSAWARIEKQGE